MFEKLDITIIQKDVTEWFLGHVWTPDSAAQIVILLTAFMLASIVSKASRKKLTDRINALTLPYRAIEILRSLTKLVFPATALILVFSGAYIVGPGVLGFNTAFSAGVVKLLVAWIVIRLIVQFIENGFARNTIALLVWVIAALSIFGILDETTTALDALGMDIGSFRLSALSVIKGLMAIFLLLYGALAVAGILDRRIGRAKSLTPSSRVLLSKVTRVVLIVSAFLVGVTMAGIDLSLFAVFSGAVGLGVGFGLQKGISNLFSGMMLLMDQSIKPGDIIEIDGTFGWVNQMGARYTEIVTRNNKSYLVPNEEFITQKVINWSHGDTLVRQETKFGVHYESDPHEVKRIAEEAAAKPERVVATPPPVCHLVEFGDSSLNFVLRYWIRDAEKGVTNTKGDIMLALWDSFREHGIRIPYPHREIFMHKEKGAA